MGNFPKFSLDDLVLYENVIYKVTSVHAFNWFLPIPYMYGLVLPHANPLEPLANKELYVREGLLEKPTEKQISAWKVLYDTRYNVDFKPTDIVQCIYIKGLFRVVEVNHTYLKITSIEKTGDMIHYIDPQFLEKIESNQEVIKVLFDAGN